MSSAGPPTAVGSRRATTKVQSIQNINNSKGPRRLTLPKPTNQTQKDNLKRNTITGGQQSVALSSDRSGEGGPSGSHPISQKGEAEGSQVSDGVDEQSE